MIPPRFTLNKEGRDLVVGDVHGCFSKLSDQLDAIGFDGAVDRLFSVGDLVDRGPESVDVLDWLAAPWFHSIQGNHEQMALWALDHEIDPRMYAQHGGQWLLDLEPRFARTIAKELAALPYVIEIDTPHGLVGLVHAACDLRSWPEFLQAFDGFRRELAIESGLYSRHRLKNGDTDMVLGIHAVIVGHTLVDTPTMLGNVLHIDTGGWKNKGATTRQFTIIDLSTMEAACPTNSPVSSL